MMVSLPVRLLLFSSVIAMLLFHADRATAANPERNSLGMEMRLLEGGRYLRGTDGGERALERAFPLAVNAQYFGHPESPKHVTWITKPFWIATTEVTVERDIDWSVKPKPEVDPEMAERYGEPYSIHLPAGKFVYEKYAKLMYDLITLAFRTDSTRVITYVVRQESSGGVFPEFGVSKGYHELTHHGNDPKILDELAAVDTIYQEHWAYFLDNMKSVKEADGRSLCLLGYSSGMGIGYSKDRLPTAMFGGGAMGVDHQGHHRFSKDAPLSTVWHTMLDRLGVETGEGFQDSAGVVKEMVALAASTD